MDKVSKEKRSEIMRRVKSRETAIEISFRKLLWNKGVRYRKNSSEYYGKPDIVVSPRKLVVFLDSCFWHGCRKHLRMPEQNRSYWEDKIRRNKQRDQNVSNYYKSKGWKIIRIWEHQLRNNQPKSINRVRRALIK